MARARNIKPAFFQNEKLAELEPIDRLAFIGLWTIADFKGCLEYRAKRLKVQILPYDDCDIETIMRNLDKSGFISIYSVDDNDYIKILNFERHQNPHKNEREAGSNIPDKDEINTEPVPFKDKTARADSLKPITDSNKETLIPKDFKINDNVVDWANKNNYRELQKHFDNFVLVAQAKGYKYKNWDAAFMRAIKDNWAKVPSSKLQVVI